MKMQLDFGKRIYVFNEGSCQRFALADFGRVEKLIGRRKNSEASKLLIKRADLPK